jgi:tetratricopeptide (TPR) repeat protein
MGSVEKTRRALAEALEIAESLDDVDAQLRTLWALAASHFYCSECREARSTAERFLRVARRTGDLAVVLIAERLLGNTLQHGGKNHEAQRYFERVIEAWVPPRDLRYTMWFRFDQRLLARAMLARTLCVQGSVSQAIDQAQISFKEAESTNHELSLCGVLHFALCPVALMTGDLVAAEKAVATLIELTTSVSAIFWKILAHCLAAELQIKRGEFAAGVTSMRTALDTCDRTGWTVWRPEFLGALANGLAGLGEFTKALATLEEALAWADRGGECWYVAELLRTKGEILLRLAGDRHVSSAEDCFSRALKVAGEQGALFWELRAAVSFARLRLHQQRPDEARQMLASVYGRFAEGLETVDLLSAKAILQSL